MKLHINKNKFDNSQNFKERRFFRNTKSTATLASPKVV